MAEQLWKGRFSKAVDSRVNDFNSSIRFDQRMIAQDMRGSGVHAAMLAKQGIISEKDCEDILNGLASIADDLASGKLEIDPNAEDVHTFVEQTLTARIGDAGKRLHTGRSRNDQVALDIRLTLRDYSHMLQGYIVELVKVICKKAAENTTAVMPGYTHLQRAQPITFGHALMAYAWMLLRDLQRFEDATARMDAQCPLGSGALAGTTYPLDRQFTAEKLGFAAPCPNSLDGVSDRDFCIELANAISICMMHLSRLSEEIILWCSWEFKFIELDDAFTTGSSIMPQKKNPDVTELIRGKTGRVYGDLNTLLVMMKGIPLAYNKDMQEDKEAIFDAVDTLELCLKTVTPMLDTMKTLPANMRRAAAKGFINATDCADYLTKKGMPFRDAYKLTGCMVSDCIAKDQTLEELTLDEFKGYSALFENDIYDAIDLIKRGQRQPPDRAGKCPAGRMGGEQRMSVKVFIDGSSGTTGLRIADRLAARPEIELLSISAEGRKDVHERAKVINSADLAFLCLPDAASKEVMPLLRPDVKVLDTSTAFRTDPAWDYGFPELNGQKEKIQRSYRVAVPGCYASGFISIARPLVELGLAPADYPFSCTGISGYSGGGKKMIAEYESPDRPAHSKLDAPKSYGLGLAHKHLPEMQKISGLAHTPAFVPVVCDYYSGMQVLVPLDLKLAGTTAEAVAEGIANYYKDGATVKVHALNETLPENGLYSNAMAGSDRMELYMTVNAAGDQMMLVSLFDNLGKGSSGAAIQCMNLMLGLEETKGLE